MSTCRIVTFAALLLGAPALAGGPDVLLLGDGVSEGQIQGAFAEAGLNVTLAGLPHEWDGVSPNVDDFDVVLHLAASQTPAMQPAADAALVSFVAGGGSLITTERTAYNAWYGFTAPGVAALLPVTSQAGETGGNSHWFVQNDAHPITAGLLDNWVDGADYSYLVPAPDAAVLVQNDEGFPMITCSDRSGGMVIHMNHDMAQSGPIHVESMQLLVNAATFGASYTPPDCNSNGVVDSVDIADGSSEDRNRNGTPDECEADCNGNGIPDDLDLEATAISTRPHIAPDWYFSDDDATTNLIPLPFPISMGGEDFVAVVQDSNGYVEFLRAGESPIDYSYGSVADLTSETDDNGNTHTYIMAAYDDLSSYYFGQFGYRIDDDRVVFFWVTETYDDGGENRLNEFQIILHASGNVQWNFNLAGFIDYGYDLYTGVYLGYGSQALTEVVAGDIPEQESWCVLGGDGDLVPMTFEYDSPALRDLDWSDADDDNYSDETALPFPVTIGNETYVAFVQDSNGYVELLRAGETYDAPGYGSLEYLTTYTDVNGAVHTYLMAAYDDLDSGDGHVYGYRMESDRVIFHWNTETYDDSGHSLFSRFEMTLYGDGRVEWDFFESADVEHGYDLFTGVFIGHDEQVLHEVLRGQIPAFRSWTFDLANAIGGGSVDANDNGIPDECELQGDVNQDGAVDFNDLLLLLGDWGACAGCPSDLNGDDAVDFTDLLIVLANWS